MVLYFFATCVAAVLLNFSSSTPITPIPQNTPTYACPPGYVWVSVQCIRITCPLGNCPCPVGTPSCQTAVAPIPVVTQPCPLGTPSCQTAVAPIPVTTQCPACPTSIISNPVTLPCLSGIICPTPPPPPPPTPPPTQPPEPIIRCPSGSILLNKTCHLVYCGRGIYRDGKCIQTICPEGTVWTGSRCTIPTPQNQTTVYMTNIIHTKLNQSTVSHQINYTNNMAIYITESPIIIETNTPPPTTKQRSRPPTNCCVVITPTVCNWEGDRRLCKSQKVHRCGPICTNGYIYLTPPHQQPPPPPPPPPPPCMTNNCGYEPRSFYPDCSGCRNTVENEFCSSHCERTICATERCQSVELRGYCRSYPGSIGCRPVDGCTQDWCGGY